MQNRFTIVTLSVALGFLLSGCPKKVSPVGTPSASKTTPESTGKIPATQENPSNDNTVGEPIVTSLQEENIPTPSVEKPTATLANPPQPSAPQEIDLSDVYFDFGQWTVRASDQPHLLQNATWLAAHPEVKIAIEGHADKRGTNEYNLVLAEKRASTILDYLVQLGIPSSRIVVMSYGEERPVCATDDESCYQENRRAHFRAD